MVVARYLGDRVECSVEAPPDLGLILSGGPRDLYPNVEGSSVLADNRALVDNAWSCALFTRLRAVLPTPDEQEAANKRARAHRRVVEALVSLSADVTSTTKEEWCSGCFTKSTHRKVRVSVGQLPAYLCSYCGTPTLGCIALGCKHMATRIQSRAIIPRYCAEHRHEIPGFAKSATPMRTIGDYEDFLSYDSPNLSRATKLAGIGMVGVGFGAPAALIAAPAIGGAVGTLIGGYSGAVATNAGLAFLGGGSLAAGGLGMAGGTMVVTAAGGALGGVLGASVVNSYAREDKSFRIEKLQDGADVPVIVCNGFLSGKSNGWGEWERIVTSRYPHSAVYRVHWGAKELKDLGILTAGAALKGASVSAIKQAAAVATKAGSRRIGPWAPVLLAMDAVKNPWHVAKNRADKTGAILADLIARTEDDSYVLIGHSLGARAMVVAAQSLGTKSDTRRVREVHLLGVAIGSKSDWQGLADGVDEAVYNYHSRNDAVLKHIYRAAQAGQQAGGFKGLTPASPRIHNLDVTDKVKSHFDYHSSVVLV